MVPQAVHTCLMIIICGGGTQQEGARMIDWSVLRIGETHYLIDINIFSLIEIG